MTAARITLVRLHVWHDRRPVNEQSTNVTLLDFTDEETTLATCRRLNTFLFQTARRDAAHLDPALFRLDVHDFFTNEPILSWSYVDWENR